ncbi:MAG: hypothetical protein ACRC0G_01595 [Fusobacteriaceae bacterium]
MLHKSSLFLDILSAYMTDVAQANVAINFIEKSEKDLMKRKPLDQITVSTLNEDLDRALRYIESQNHIIQAVGQLKISIMRKKLDLEKKLTSQEQAESAKLEFDPDIVAIKSKAEQTKVKKEAAKVASQDTRDELDSTKIELNAIEIFVVNSNNNRELAMSYYQAVKGVMPKHN